MKALTLVQPWATLIALGHKKIETRGWHPRENPGLLAITSSNKKPTASQREMIESDPFRSALAGAELPTGKLVAVVIVTGFRRTDDLRPPANEAPFGDFRPGRWAWLLGEVVALDRPIHVKGARSVWELPLHLTESGDGRPGPLVRALGGRRAYAELIRRGQEAAR